MDVYMIDSPFCLITDVLKVIFGKVQPADLNKFPSLVSKLLDLRPPLNGKYIRC